MTQTRDRAFTVKENTAPGCTPPRMVLKENQGYEQVDRLLEYSAAFGDFAPTKWTLSYDKYGFLAAQESNDNRKTTYSYEWTQPGKVWNKKTTTGFSGGAQTSQTVVSRTFHANGMVKTQDTADGTDVLHEEYDPDGYLVYSVKKDPGNNVLTEKRWHYFEPGALWLCDSYSYDSSTRTSNIIGKNYYTIITESFDVNSQTWVKAFESTVYYNGPKNVCGNFSATYSNGELLWGSGFINGFEVEGDGCYSVVSGSFNGSAWEFYAMEDYALNFKQMTDPENHPSESWSIRYIRNSSGEFIPDVKTTYTFINDRIVKAVDRYINQGFDIVNYYMLNAEKRQLEAISYNEANGSYICQSLDGEWLVYSYRDADDTETQRLRYRSTDDITDYGEYWQSWNGAEWCDVTDYLEFELDGIRHECTFDAAGRLVLENVYDAEGNLTQKSETTYEADGSLKYERSRSIKGVLVVVVRNIYDAVAATFTLEQYEYDSEGNCYYAYRQVHYEKTGLNENYSYTPDTQSWLYMSSWVDMREETLEDGTKIQISSRVDENRNIIPESKTESRNESDGSGWNVRYAWDKTAGDWKPLDKTIRRLNHNYTFDYDFPADPEAIEDDYFSETSKPSDGAGEQPMTRFSYTWDDATSDWMPVNVDGPETTVDGNTLVSISYYDGYKSVTTTSVNDVRNVVSWKVEDVYPDHTNTSVERNFDYDEQGRVVKSVLLLDSGSTKFTYLYTYGPVTIYSGIDDAISDADDASEADGGYTVYNLQGIRLLHGAGADALKSLPEGLYIVNGRKTVIRR